MYKIVVLSGPIAAGKSTLGKALAGRGMGYLSTRGYLREICGPDAPREELQAMGKRLDAEKPEWFGEYVESMMSMGPMEVVVADAARRPSQIEDLQRRFGAHHVLHVHLEADETDLYKRYQDRGEQSTYYNIKADSLEKGQLDLRRVADIVINTSHETAACTFSRVFARLRPPVRTPNVDVLVGAQYGSEGKGHVVAHIASEYDTLVRVGGPNAGHSVLYKGTHTSFYHLPSGCLHAPDAKLVFGPGMNIRIPVLMAEMEKARSLGADVGHRLFIDPNANVITDEDIALEVNLVASIGSTGQGVGFATAGKILLRGQRKLAKDYPDLKHLLHETDEVLESSYVSDESVLLEGTQGTGLSLHHGPYPYVTSRDTTASGTLGDAGIAPSRVRKVLMVARTNPIRVQSPQDGTSGPMARELTWEEVSERSGVSAEDLRQREKTTTTKRLRRVSEFDWALFAKACRLNGPTDIALTFADYMSPENTQARRYEQLTWGTQQFVTELEAVSGCPVSLITTRLHEKSIIDRRAW